MADERVYVGDIGTIIDIDCQESLVAATGQKIKVKKPSGTQSEWTATISTNSLRHTVIAGELDEAGEYLLQPYMTLGTWTGRGKTVALTVYRIFEAT